MSRVLLLPIAVAAAVASGAAPARAQSAPNDELQRMYDAPLKRLYDDPMKKYYRDTTPATPAPPPSIYPDNPLIPGGQPQAPRTFNQLPSPAAPPAALPPGVVTGAQPYGNQPAYDPRFRHFDANNDGRISREEYVRSQMQRVPPHPSVGDMRAGPMMQRFDSRFGGVDANHDGQITRQEYDAAGNPRF